jgi:hypothetical protein
MFVHTLNLTLTYTHSSFVNVINLFVGHFWIVIVTDILHNVAEMDYMYSGSCQIDTLHVLGIMPRGYLTYIGDHAKWIHIITEILTVRIQQTHIPDHNKLGNDCCKIVFG